MTINGVDIDFQVFDADQLDMFRNAQDTIKKNCDTIFANEHEATLGGMSTLIRETCGMAEEFLNDAFGKGTAKKVLGNGANLLKCMDAMMQIGDQLPEVMHSQAKEFEAMSNRYQPQK